MFREERQQPVLILRQAEEEVLLAYPVRFRAVDRTGPLDEVLLLLERLTRDAVPPFVEPLVDIAGCTDAADEFLHACPVPRLGRPDEVVEGEVETPPDVEELSRHPIAIGQRLFAQFLRLAEDVLRVFVVPHHEVHVEAGQPLVTRDHVGGNLLVRRPEVRAAVDVVDGGR